MSLSNSKYILRERTKEIKNYLIFLKKIISNNAALFYSINNSKEKIEKDLTHTLKANAYLLYYNVIEAVVSTSIIEVHEVIKNSDIKYSINDLNNKLSQEILEKFKKNGSNDYQKSSENIGKWLIEDWIKQHKIKVDNQQNPLISGNLDGRKIIEIAQKYGMETSILKNPKNTSPEKAKVLRNNLAHGNTSFRDCGKDLAINDVFNDAVGVIIFLRRYLRVVESYLDKKLFLLANNL